MFKARAMLNFFSFEMAEANAGCDKKDLEEKVESEKSKRTDNTDLNVNNLIDDIRNYVSDSEAEIEICDRPFVEKNDGPSFKVLPPHLPKHLVKGKSKTNLSKGKRPLNENICSIDGDLIPEKASALKRIYDLTEESIRLDRLERLRITLKTRITELNNQNLFTLEDVVRVFQSQTIPISLKLPLTLSTISLASLLLIEESSPFIESIKNSINIQELMRRYLLEEKNLPTCRCGYIYIHPSLTYTKHPSCPTLMVGNIGTMVAIEQKSNVLKLLNSMRLYLEILYENITMK
jgi:hypothetical protein